MFQAKNKKKRDRNDNQYNSQNNNNQDQASGVFSWRNFGNVGAFSQKK